jgi:hypothetical protein
MSFHEVRKMTVTETKRLIYVGYSATSRGCSLAVTAATDPRNRDDAHTEQTAHVEAQIREVVRPQPTQGDPER